MARTIDTLNHLEKSLNFSTKLYKRKDGKWGVPITLPNGTIILNGMLKSITESHVDMICASLSIVESRLTYVDYLVPITQVHASLFIANNDNFDTIDWTVYLTPFTLRVWLIIIASTITIVIIIIVMEKQYNVEMVSYNFRAKKITKFSYCIIVEHITINSYSIPCIIIS